MNSRVRGTRSGSSWLDYVIVYQCCVLCIPIESKDLHRFVKCMKDLCATVNDDVLDTFLSELGYQGHPPSITMATDIAAALHEE